MGSASIGGLPLGVHLHNRFASIEKGGLPQSGVRSTLSLLTTSALATATVGTDPTGTHSCLKIEMCQVCQIYLSLLYLKC